MKKKMKKIWDSGTGTALTGTGTTGAKKRQREIGTGTALIDTGTARRFLAN